MGTEYVLLGWQLGAFILGDALVLLLTILCLMRRRMRKVQDVRDMFELIEQQRMGIWMEYVFYPQSLEIISGVNQLGNNMKTKLLGEEVFDIFDLVYDEDVSIRSRIRNFFDSDDKFFQTNLRLKNCEGEYSWYEIRGTMVKDLERKENIRFVVTMENVDYRIKQERNLLQKAENDLLTGILNKKTMEERVVELLKMRGESQHFVYFIIDLDNFKTVNDTLGHIYGDTVLSETSEKIRMVFPNRALAGRIGGDEFAVFASFDAFDRTSLYEFVGKKGDALKNKLQGVYGSDNNKVSVSCSIGISIAPDMGNTFQQLYQKADKALYLSKRSGKNCYHIYEDEGEKETM